MELFWSEFYRIWTENGEILRIQSNCEKMRTRITPNTDTFHTVHGWLMASVQTGKLRTWNAYIAWCFKTRLKICPTFQIFIQGSTNYHKSAVDDHARSKKSDPKHPHTVAYKKYLSIKNVELKSRSKTLAETVNKQNTDAVSSFGNVS